MKPGCKDCFPRGCHPLWQQRLQRGCSSTLYSSEFLSTSMHIWHKTWTGTQSMTVWNLRLAKAAWMLHAITLLPSCKLQKSQPRHGYSSIDFITDREKPSFAATIGRVPDTDDYLHLPKISAVPGSISIIIRKNSQVMPTTYLLGSVLALLSCLKPWHAKMCKALPPYHPAVAQS